MSEKEFDVFRDSGLRYLGYANEVGEAFRPLVHVNWVRLSYGIAVGYVFADTYDKARKTAKEELGQMGLSRKVLTSALDTLLWQSFASVIIPGLTINRLCASTLYILSKTTKLPKPTRKWMTTGVGLASIPFIIKPIDRFVEAAMERTFRKWVT